MSTRPCEHCIGRCERCGSELHSPFVPHPEHRDPDGFGTFAHELTRELGVEPDEITITDVARAWMRAMGWRETGDGWYCQRCS
jgi:hypothetical protein